MSATAGPRTISVAIPAYNEAGNLERAVAATAAAASGFDDFEILIVNDGSSDGTAEVSERLASADSHVRALHHPHNLGFATAYRTAMAQATLRYFTFVPGDAEIMPDSIREIFSAVGKADLVVPYHGTPWKRTRLRRILTWCSTAEINLLFGWHLRYYQGPTVYPTALARVLPQKAMGFFFASEMLVHALSMGCDFVEVGLAHEDRAYGRSKAVAWRNVVNAQATILRLWWEIRVRRANKGAQRPGDVSSELAETVEV
jgi:glycosyltransferase involved in cell wall biosynthesis